MQIQENLIRGAVDIALLQILVDRDMYGYEILQEIRRISDDDFIIKEGTMYPVMYRMIDRGLVTERPELVGKRRIRKYYHLTDEGKEYLNEIKAEYYKFARGMEKILNYRNEVTECPSHPENEENI